MRLPLSWLREFTDVQLTPEQLADALTLRGLEVRGIERWGATWNHIVIGELLEVGPHPRADRLQLTKVRIGKDEVLNVVCGARNIAAGQRIPVALVGAQMPDGRLIERAEKMGVASEGMLCSGTELNATDDGDGILILDAKAPLGVPLVDWIGDDVIDVDVKPNRGDLLSVLGLAREVAAITGAPLRSVARALQESSAKVGDGLALEVSDAALAPRVVLRVVDGVKVAPSPDAVQMRLKAAGMRSVSNVVDATNYIMLELGKPTHAFDRSAVGATLSIRAAKRGEQLETLDHVTRELDAADLVVADERSALALAGVMGGASSEVSAATSSVIIESAIFAPGSVRRSAQRHSLRSEASHRFERGQESALAPAAADAVASLLAAWAGGSARAGRLDSAPSYDAAERSVVYRPSRVRSLIGIDLDDAGQAKLLGTIGMVATPAKGASEVPVTPKRSVKASGDAYRAIVPTWRRDLEIEADIAEEVARLYGYDRLTPHLPGSDPVGYAAQPTALRDVIRQHLAGRGLHEVVTHALVSEQLSARYAEPADAIPAALAESEGRAVGGSSAGELILANPLSVDHDRLRRSLLPSLLDRVDANLRYGANSGALFEVGRGYGASQGGPVEWTRLSLALWGEVEPAAPGGVARAWDLDEVKRLVAGVASHLDARPAYEALPDAAAGTLLHPGRSAHVFGDLVAGVLGELHPAAPEWRESPRILLVELAIRGLASGSPMVRSAIVPAPTPPIERDMAIALPAGVTVGALVALARTHVGNATSVELFDLFAGGSLGAGERSAGLRFTFQPESAGAADAAVETALDAFATAARKDLGARVRGAEGG